MRLLFFSIVFISSSSMAAGIQKWIDENGQIHYGDAPPAKVKVESIRVTKPPSNPGKPLPRFSPSEENNQSSTGTTEQPPAPQNPEEQAKQDCDRARNDLDIIKRNTRIQIRKDDGSTRLMTSEEIEERRKSAEKSIELFCK